MNRRMFNPGTVQLERWGRGDASGRFGGLAAGTAWPGIHHHHFAFTLIELLVVISIIGVLAGMILAAILNAQRKAQIMSAKLDMKNLAMALGSYEGAYSRLPATGAGSADITFGLAAITPAVPGTSQVAANSQVMIVLQDLDLAPNAGHALNTQSIAANNFRPDSSLASPGWGVSTVDHQFRDPWRHPYVVTLDMNSDSKCRDAFYGLPQVSQQAGKVGYNGLSDNGSGYFELNASWMIWSSGPDGKADPSVKANQGVNKDNVLGWQ